METNENLSNSEQGIIHKKTPKKGIIYLSTIPEYMNVIKVREIFSGYGKVGRVFLQPFEKDSNGPKPAKRKKNKYAKNFSEGWVEFERKSVAKKVAALLNNTQISMRKKSKFYDCIWNIKYLPSFKWTHLNERLAYERAVRKQKLRAEIAQVKRQANFFNLSLEKSAKQKMNKNTNIVHNLEINNKNEKIEPQDDRQEFLKELFS